MAKKPQLDHDQNGKAGGAAPKFAFKPVCGLSEEGVDAFIDEAEQLDKGTTRFPWNDRLKEAIKVEISGMTFMPDVKKRVNELVVEARGPGLFGRGPFNLPVV
jgi:hypothetical protein